jgi:uncharacterized membrane protein YecN with MAPEG domain
MDLGLVHMPLYTGLTATILMVLQVVLMFRVIGARGKNEVMIGTGDNAAMEQAIRVHGNLVENAPIFLIGMALIELIGGSSLWVMALGCVFVVSRLAHAIGFSMSVGVTPGRLAGTLGTMISIVVAAVYLAYLVINRM